MRRSRTLLAIPYALTTFFLLCFQVHAQGTSATQAETSPVVDILLSGQLATKALPVRELDAQTGFAILVWQFKTDALKDADSYARVGLRGWHVDYGAGQEERVRWGQNKGWPYYVDHAAGKGILHLTERTGLKQLPNDGTAIARPQSLIDAQTYRELCSQLERNLPVVKEGPVLAIALDDEVSTGTFNSPIEVDYSPQSLELFHRWLPSQYATPDQLRQAYSITAAGDNEELRAEPKTYEGVRKQIQQRPPQDWRLAPWLDFRSFMDSQQAALFSALVGHANQLAPEIPVGVVGGQQPSAYGGFDYAKLRHALQWTEAYDIGGTNEILRSFWSEKPRQGRMQTFFASGKTEADKYFLWYYLAHGCRGVIAWPDSGGKAWFEQGEVHPAIQRLADTFRQVQGEELAVLADPSTEPLFSPIAVLYSHPSIQVGWAIDASTHGGTWPRRSSSLDNDNLSSGRNRIAWLRLLEDLGHQPRVIDTSELTDDGFLSKRFKVLVLPQAFALSQAECGAIERFVEQGGHVVADYGTAITDEHGSGYSTPPLDRLFGLARGDNWDWFTEQRRFEVDGEKYGEPFVDRLPTSYLNSDLSTITVERSLAGAWLTNQVGTGTTLYLNQSPTAYYDNTLRRGDIGNAWRKRLGTWLKTCAVEETVRIVRSDGQQFGLELLRYQIGTGEEIWAVVANPTRQAAVDGPGSGLMLESTPIDFRFISQRPVVQVTNLRTGEVMQWDSGREFSVPADEAWISKIRWQE